MEPYLPALTEHLATAELSPLILSIMDQIAKDNTQCCIDYKEQLMEVAKDNPATAPQVARIMGRIGRLNEVIQKLLSCVPDTELRLLHFHHCSLSGCSLTQ